MHRENFWFWVIRMLEGGGAFAGAVLHEALILLGGVGARIGWFGWFYCFLPDPSCSFVAFWVMGCLGAAADLFGLGRRAGRGVDCGIGSLRVWCMGFFVTTLLGFLEGLGLFWKGIICWD